MTWRVCNRPAMLAALCVGTFVAHAWPQPVEAGRRDDRDFRQMLREQRRLERLRQRDDDDDDKPSPAKTAPVAPMPAAPAAASSPAPASANADKSDASSGGDRPSTGGGDNGRGRSKADRQLDRDGDGVPDTLAGLMKVILPKMALPPPPPGPATGAMGRTDGVPDVKPGQPSPRAPSGGVSGSTPAQGAGRPSQESKPGAPSPSPQASGASSPTASAVPGRTPPAPPASAPAPASAQAAQWSGRVVTAGTKGGANLALPDLPARPGELLAVNMTPQVAARAHSLGYVVGPPETLSSLGLQLSRVILPPGADLGDAMSRLGAGSGPVGTTLAVNSVYRSIRSAMEADTPAPTPTPSISGTGCPASRCYGMQTINWSPALANCARQVRVGVIDTGIDVSHPAFKRRIHVADVHQGTQRVVNSAHGTGVLALLAGDPSSSTPGLIPDAEFYAVNIFYADKSGAAVSDTAHLLRALDILGALEVRVINLSLTGPRDDLVEAAVARLASKGTIMIAAAGNEGPAASPAYPAAYPDVIAVTAVNREKRAYRSANHGDYIDVAAPGVDIWTALPNRGQGPLSGTSLAAPFVSAVIAGLYPTLPQKTKASALAHLDYADLGAPGRDPVYGNGLVVSPKACHSATTVVTAPPAQAPVVPVRGWDRGTVVTRPAATSTAGFGLQ